MADTVVHLGEVVSTSGSYLLLGGPTNGGLAGMLSDSSPTTLMQVAPGQVAVLEFRLKASDVAAIPDGLVGGVTFHLEALFARTQITIAGTSGGTVSYPDPTEVFRAPTTLEYFDLSRPDNPSGNVDGPTVNGIDVDTLRYGKLRMVIDASKLRYPVNVYEAYLKVETNVRPTVTPLGISSNGDRPQIQFSFTDPENRPLEAFKMWLFTEEQASATGFDPNTATPVQYSGVVNSSSLSYTFERPVSPNIRYRAYAVASEVGANARFTTISAAGPFVSFEVTADAGPIPVFTAEHTGSPSRVALQLSSSVNLLDGDAAKLKTVTVGNDGITRYYDTAVDRKNALARAYRTVINSTTKPIFMEVGRVPVVPGQTFSASMRVRRNSTFAAGTGSLAIQFRTASGESRGNVVQSVPKIVGEAGIPTVLNATAVVAPTLAAYASLVVAIQVTAANQEYAFDSARLVQDSTINLLNNPLLDRDGHWLPYATSGVADITRKYVAPLVLGERSTAVVIGVNNGWTGLRQLFELTPGQTYTVVAAGTISKAGQVRITSSQFAAATVEAQANVPVLIETTFTAGAQSANDNASDFVALTTNVAGATFTPGFVVVLPSPLTYDGLTSLRFDDWTPGQGDNANPIRYRVERSIDDGQTWTAVRVVSSAIQANGRRSLVLDDYDAPGNTTVLYRARSVTYTEGANPVATQSSPSVTVVAAGVGSATAENWLISRSDPNLRMQVRIDLPFEQSRSKNASIKTTLEGKPVVQYGGISGYDGSIDVDLISAAERELLDALYELDETLLLSLWDGRRLNVDLYGDMKVSQIADSYFKASFPYVETETPVFEE